MTKTEFMSKWDDSSYQDYKILTVEEADKAPSHYGSQLLKVSKKDLEDMLNGKVLWMSINSGEYAQLVIIDSEDGDRD